MKHPAIRPANSGHRGPEPFCRYVRQYRGEKGPAERVREALGLIFMLSVTSYLVFPIVSIGTPVRFGPTLVR